MGSAPHARCKSVKIDVLDSISVHRVPSYKRVQSNLLRTKQGKHILGQKGEKPSHQPKTASRMGPWKEHKS